MVVQRELSDEARRNLPKHHRCKTPPVVYVLMTIPGFLLGYWLGSTAAEQESGLLVGDNAAVWLDVDTAQRNLARPLIYSIEPGSGCDEGDEAAFGRNDRCADNPPLREEPGD